MNEETVVVDFSEFQNREPPKPKPRPPMKPVDHYTIEGIFLRTYKNATEAHKETGVKQDIINRCCQGKQLHVPSVSSIFLYDGDDIEARMHLIEEKTPTRIVYEYSLHGELLHTYANYATAAIANNTSTDNIRNCVKGRSLISVSKIFLHRGDSIEKRLHLIEERNKRNKVWLPIKEYSIKGEFLRDWPNIASAQKYYGTVGNIGLCCSGRILTAIGKIFLYPKDSIEERLERLKHRRHQPSLTQKVKIKEYDLNGTFIKKWDSMTEAEKFYNIPQGSVCHCCKGDRLATHGKIFLYERHSIEKRLKLIKEKENKNE